MVAVDDALSRFLRDAGEKAQVYFAASCVERGSDVFFLAVASEQDRGADVETYLRLLEDLWVAAGLSPEERASHQERIDAFSEMQTEGDDKPPGILAFAFDAVAAMYDAYTYLVTGDSDNITYTSNHNLNSAGFIDDAVAGESNRYEQEIATQLRDMETLSADFASVDLAVLRDQARTIGRGHIEALRTAFH
ncbi:hypothetical protein GCM10029976_039810 [Kribbella albertanoniae]|uniref:Uncharacterized protein n=1 Tax=Kribbella albertanoniae TaxID=1266829 RepID=A0A4R4Q906_9ACTN|nr:hypothetical protein [Kribbella albertanoniae]TDC31816.1 hypothetical protein E1261_09940 [Kribbella albertanoniae]